MNGIHSEEQLSKLLAYHVNLIDDAFVESVMRKIDRAFWFRQWVLSIFTVFGLIGGLVGLSSLWPANFWVVESQIFSRYSPLYLTLVFVAVVFFFTWVFNEEFDAP